ncbi:MAG TPA: aminodeoxychorismate/anthranilate synthase component II [bacterium]|nr:aminodeoxychorismate/anthranilate synthase component II [bacterium]
MILLIDNYDSFTYNLYQYLMELGALVQVHRNDQITLDDIATLRPAKIVISPGPCTPNEAGISMDVVKRFAGQIPILGVCLGHQALAQAYGGSIIRAPKIMHGKTSPIFHNGRGLYRGLPNPFLATRYHSLIVERESLPSLLEVTAWTEDQLIMGMGHRDYPVYGVQFHPESILTTQGHALLRNFLDQVT